MRATKNRLAATATLKHFKNGAPQNLSYVFFPVTAFVYCGCNKAVQGLQSTTVAMHTFLSRGLGNIVDHDLVFYIESSSATHHGNFPGPVR